MQRIPAQVVRRVARLGAVAAVLVAPVLVAAPAVAVTAAAATSAAAAGPDCSAAIVDSAHALAGGAATRAALAQFSGLTIQLRVRTYSSLPQKDPDAQEKRLEQQCPGWRAEDGTRRSDLMSVIVDTGDRRTGLFFGSDWDAQLQENFASIESDDMNPEFQNGRFDEGIAAGLNSVFNDVSDNWVPADPTLDEYGNLVGGEATAALPIGNSTDPGAAFFGVGVVLVVLVFIGGLAASVFRGSQRRGRGSQPFDPNNAGLNGTTGFFGDPGSSHHHHNGGGSGGGFMGGGGGGFSGGDGGGGGGGGGGSSSW